MPQWLYVYWIIGFILIIIMHLMGVFYKAWLKDAYIPPKKHVSFLVSLFMNILLTLLYPIFVLMLLWRSTVEIQERRFLETKLDGLQEFLNQKIKEHQKGDQHETTEPNPEKK